MNLVRRLTPLLLVCALFLSLSLASCAPEEKKSAKLTIVTTIFPPYDFAREIAGETTGVSIKMLLPPGSESHDYEPSLEDVAAIAECDLFICVGGETDKWVEGVLEVIDTDVNVLRLLDCVEALDEEHLEGMEPEDGDEAEVDEHVWTSLRNSEVIVREIEKKMAEACPEYADDFAEKANRFCDELRELDREFTALTEGAERRTLIFADRFPFRYFAEDYGLECYAAYQGCASDAEPTLASIDLLMGKLVSTDSTAVLIIEFSKGEAARLIAEETGTEVLTLHSCHNVSREDFDGGVSYTYLMRRNLEVLRKVLS